MSHCRLRNGRWSIQNSMGPTQEIRKEKRKKALCLSLTVKTRYLKIIKSWLEQVLVGNGAMALSGFGGQNKELGRIPFCFCTAFTLCYGTDNELEGLSTLFSFFFLTHFHLFLRFC